MVEVTTLDALIKEFGMPSYIKIDVEGYELEVIKGLCSAIPLVSFEFTPELLDVTHECIACLAQLGDIECNYSLGESSFEFNLPNWVTPMELGKELETIRDDITQFGDVFIRTRSRV